MLPAVHFSLVTAHANPFLFVYCTVCVFQYPSTTAVTQTHIYSISRGMKRNHVFYGNKNLLA